MLFSSLPVKAEESDTGEPAVPSAPLTVIVTEIYANAPGSNESGSEYVELHNTTDETIDLTGYYLFREGSDTQLLLDDIELIGDEYLAVITPFSLLNSGGTIYLQYPETEGSEPIIIEQDYLGLDEMQSWSLIGDTWQNALPTPSEANPEPNEEPAEKPTEESQLCEINTVFINEVVANPSGADSDGGEFIELYNDGVEAVLLTGCFVKTDKLDKFMLDDVQIEAGAYYIVELANDLLNGGGEVAFVSNANEYAITYPELGDDDSWSLIDGSWQLSKVQTPGKVNQPTPPEPEQKASTTTLSPCPEGKFRNPETNRCKNIASTVSTLKPCDPGETRNPATNRCRKVTSTISSLKPCDPGQERNPATNRCRNIQSATNELKPCDEGEERSPETNRCRKISQVLSGATIDPPINTESGIHSNVFIAMTAMALGYGIFEYRLDFSNLFNKIKASKLLQKQR